MSKKVTYRASMNIAVIKYWGKRDEELILPINDSISLTLKNLESFTCTSFLEKGDKDLIILNDEKPQEVNKRVENCLHFFRSRTSNYRKVLIVSKNNFPTAAGLASSASGYCCLVYSLSKLYKVKDVDLSIVARMGSGSACRSMYGGFVKWIKGEKLDGSDSRAVQLKDEKYWDDLRIIILVVNSEKKKIGSTEGMRLSVKTSNLLKQRLKILPERLDQMEKAIEKKDFQVFGKLMMKDSDNFHAVCNDTTPSIHYLNQTSHKIINWVRKFNEIQKSVIISYTYDAGPNAVLFTKKKNQKKVLDHLLHYFPPNEKFYHEDINEITKLNNSIFPKQQQITKGKIERFILTKGGSGPCIGSFKK